MQKKWWQQKTTWSGLALVVTGIGSLVVGEGLGSAGVPLAEGVGMILAGLGLVSMRAAVEAVIRALAK